MSDPAVLAALARLAWHPTHAEIVKRRMRDDARMFEDLAELSRGNAALATFAAMSQEGPPTPEFSRRETWTDRIRLLDRAAALDELATSIRCGLAVLRRSVAQ